MSDRFPFAGDTRREHVLVMQGDGWIVRLDALDVARARSEGRPIDSTLLEVRCEWTGAGLPEFPPRGTPVAMSDCVVVEDDPELARAVAHAAADELRGGHDPGLRQLTARLRARVSQ